jgi:hypothetical protein
MMTLEEKHAELDAPLGVPLPLIETIAERVHEAWMEGRRREGWTHGEFRDDIARTHPGMVAYEDLPDSEKEYDRRTALATIRAIQSLGYRIVPSEATEP